jgi:hypothetical protein
MSNDQRELEAVHLRDNRYAVRPVGCLGTDGWQKGRAWSVIFITARSADEAIKKARSYSDE